MPANILIIDDEQAIAWALRRAFEGAGNTATMTATAEDGLRRAAITPPDLIFLDIRLPGLDGLSALEQLRKTAPNAAIIIMTAHGNLSTAVQAVEGGAFDYLAKPFELQLAMDAARRALARNAAAEESPRSVPGPDVIIGQSAAIQHLFKRIAMVAGTDASVLITGESGTGKELVARAIHTNSRRKQQPFVPVHIAAMNPNLVESELFGHVRGAFTGADRPRAGLLENASGGTVFLDELADIPLPIQAKLLRVLERQEMVPVGGTTPVRFDVRIVSATHANLSAAVHDGKFRHDLFYRLNVFPIHIPPLRDRLEDLPQLALHFLQSWGHRGGLSEEALLNLRKRSWPGNVREFRNALEHAAILARDGPFEACHFSAEALLNPTPVIDGIGLLQKALESWVHEQLRTAGTPPTDLYDRFLKVA
ncbi:MAG: sigma-54-dependent transcriptional regulator, partial [Gemmataceae bacterium]